MYFWILKIKKMRKLILILPLLSFLMFSCKKEKPSVSAVLATLTTDSVTLITSTTAKSGGNITNDGGAPIISRGICWSTTPNESILGNHSTDGAGNGSFTSTLLVLTPGTQYFLRAYATNSIGTAYGNEVVFTSVKSLTITTTAATSISINSANSGGNILSEGNNPILDRGICWSTFQNPTISDSKTRDGSGIGSFSSNINGLALATTYYVRAYATLSSGTSYGNEVSFTTKSISIGDTYEGGIVAYVDGTGKHGFIAAPFDQDNAIMGCTMAIGARGIAIGTGYQNTLDILNACGATTNAARVCYNLDLNGYSDWFLPSTDELDQMYKNKAVIGSFAPFIYWSSTIHGTAGFEGKVQEFADGSRLNKETNTAAYRVRAIRSF